GSSDLLLGASLSATSRAQVPCTRDATGSETVLLRWTGVRKPRRTQLAEPCFEVQARFPNQRSNYYESAISLSCYFHRSPCLVLLSSEEHTSELQSPDHLV